MVKHRQETIRQSIIALLEEFPSTARDISKCVGITEKDVDHHLSSIEKTLKHLGKMIQVHPCQCLTCGFEFKTRKRFSRPGKCPECKSSRIESAVYHIVSR